MKAPTTKTHILTLGVALGLTLGQVGWADDTEVYKPSLTPSQAALLKPNVLFVVDTSGSMGSTVTGSAHPYDPGTTYSGSCSDTRVYWSTNGSVPTCSTNQFFLKSQLRCDAGLQQLNAGGAGVFQDRVARYQTSTQDWRALGTTSTTQMPPHVECEADRGTHGETTASSQTYIVSGAGAPWPTKEAGEKTW
ncbi:MAG: hypothetical protein AAF493_07095, partial [Pseudomonadota bacterium]